MTDITIAGTQDITQAVDLSGLPLTLNTAATPTQAAALNSFSTGSILGTIWDDTKNAFNTGLAAASNVLAASGVAAAAAAQQKAQNSTLAGYTLPTVPVSASLDPKTMLFLGVAAVAVLFILKGK